MVEIQDTNITFKSVYDSPYTPQDEAIKEADCLIIPYENIRPNVEYSYSEYAEELLEYIREKQEIIIDIAATDDVYEPLEMHSMLLELGKFLVMDTSFSILLNLVSSFIYDKLKQFHTKDAEVHVEYIVQKTDGSSKSINYTGPASEFDTIRESVQEL